VDPRGRGCPSRVSGQTSGVATRCPLRTAQGSGAVSARHWQRTGTGPSRPGRVHAVRPPRTPSESRVQTVHRPDSTGVRSGHPRRPGPSRRVRTGRAVGSTAGQAQRRPWTPPHVLWGPTRARTDRGRSAAGRSHRRTSGPRRSAAPAGWSPGRSGRRRPPRTPAGSCHTARPAGGMPQDPHPASILIVAIGPGSSTVGSVPGQGACDGYRRAADGQQTLDPCPSGPRTPVRVDTAPCPSGHRTRPSRPCGRRAATGSDAAVRLAKPGGHRDRAGGCWRSAQRSRPATPARVAARLRPCRRPRPDRGGRGGVHGGHWGWLPGHCEQGRPDSADLDGRTLRPPGGRGRDRCAGAEP
jgi:hypothetical protein